MILAPILASPNFDGLGEDSLLAIGNDRRGLPSIAAFAWPVETLTSRRANLSYRACLAYLW